MQPIEGIHHISLITGDAPRNVDFYARVLGLRLVKKTVNQDDPRVYHLFYADDAGSPGADITFFEYPGAPPGEAGAGMVETIVHRVADAAALDFWRQRLAEEGTGSTRTDDGNLRFSDPEGVHHELTVAAVPDAPLTAASDGVPAEHALQGFDAVRTLVVDPARSGAFVTEALQFTAAPTGGGHEYEARGSERGGRISFIATSGRGRPGAGTVHHVAWSVPAAEQMEWRSRVAKAGARPTPVIDRFWFESVYFREPGGILYELATRDGAGFAADEEPELLGERLVLPPFLEHDRSRIEPQLTPLPDTRQWRTGRQVSPDATPG